MLVTILKKKKKKKTECYSKFVKKKSDTINNLIINNFKEFNVDFKKFIANGADTTDTNFNNWKIFVTE